MRHSPAVAILGARQVGKTTLAKQIGSAQKKECIYLDLENPLDARKLADPYTFLHDNKDKCIIIDEVQTIPSYRELSPINLMELPERISRNRHWLRGGFPNALLARSDKIAFEWISSFARSYVERDLSALFGVSLTSNILSRLLSMLAHVNGSVWNAEMIARSLGISAPTVNRYIDFLEGAFLVHRLQPFHFNTRKRLVKAPKVYVRDSGLLHHLSHVYTMNTLKGHPVVGSSWEGYVVEQIKELMPQNISQFYYRTQAGAECDIVLVKGSQPVACVEVKLNNAPVISKGNQQSIADLKTKKNFVVVPDVDEYKTKDGIIICNIRTFLEKYLPRL